MNNKVASKLSLTGTIYFILSIIAGIFVMFQETERELELIGETISEWNPIVIVYGVIIIVSGIVICLVFKGIAELIENTYLNLAYQKEILNELKSNKQNNLSELSN